MRSSASYVIVSIVAVVLLVGLLYWNGSQQSPGARPPGGAAGENTPAASAEPGNALFLYCAAGMKEPVRATAEAYGKEYGIPVQIQYGGSGTLLSSLKISQKGDLYLAADTSYTDMAHEQGLVEERIPVAYLRPVIVVAPGNPKNIGGVADLTREEVRTSLGAPEAASVGKQTKLLLEKLGRWEAIEAAVRDRGVFKPTVNEVATDVKIGTIDAGIVWDATAAQFHPLKAIALEGAEDFVKTVTIGVLTSSRQPTAALRFARYLSARDRGLPEFEKRGFPPVDGDEWAWTPALTYYSGGVNRVAIEKTLEIFQAREGCTVRTVYNGCGILVGQMKLGERPDVYHSCDISFMREITDLFDPAVSVSQTDMVLTVPKGNPKNLRTLKDLGTEGLRLGLANEQQSALGALTARLLKQAGVYDAVVKNVVSRTPTADLLVNQIRTGSLDAVIVYRANTTYAGDHLDIISLGLDAAIAEQTYAVGKNSNHKQLAARLYEKLGTAQSQAQYANAGFRWLAE